MNEDVERSKREVLDWLSGNGSTFVAALAAIFIVVAVLVGAGVI